ncbi:Uncharacterised protein [uncultured archaeon]|nr:Uncharacterised protein [uncultured archaeon]
MASIGDLEARVDAIEERNKKVESDKAWETSLARRTLLFVFTYLAVGIYLYEVNIPNPWLNAIVPAVGFMLSTLTLPYFKGIWLNHARRK